MLHLTPSNHSLRRLYCFRDPRLEREYRPFTPPPQRSTLAAFWIKNPALGCPLVGRQSVSPQLSALLLPSLWPIPPFFPRSETGMSPCRQHHPPPAPAPGSAGWWGWWRCGTRTPNPANRSSHPGRRGSRPTVTQLPSPLTQGGPPGNHDLRVSSRCDCQYSV